VALAGQIRHRDSVGSDVIVRPGELNIMTAGRGVSHSEFAVLPAAELGGTDDGGAALPLQRGLQLWVALPDGERDRPPAFEQHRDLPTVHGPGLHGHGDGGNLRRCFLAGHDVHPIVGADVACGGTAAFPLDPAFEHAVLVLDGGLTVDGQEIGPGPLGYLGAGREVLPWTPCRRPRFLLIGGEPLQEELLMWWNFVGRTHEEVAQARADWEAQAELPDAAAEGARFGLVRGHGPDAGREAGRIPAPPLPGVKLRPRTRS
jgi:redox-sensitive bicupin YhaK (pirin superfamily)